MTRRTHFECVVDGCAGAHDAKGLCRVHYRRWKRLGNPLAPLKIAAAGSGWICKKGYRYFTVGGKNRSEHKMVAERVLGKPLPEGAVIHHADENRLNNASSNLVICLDDNYHKLLHMRMNARAACGNPDWRLCPYCHEYGDPAAMQEQKTGYGPRFVHPVCGNFHRNKARGGTNARV